MYGKRLDSIAILQLTRHILWEVAFNLGRTIGTLLYLCINVLDDFFKNDVNLRAPFMPMAGRFV